MSGSAGTSRTGGRYTSLLVSTGAITAVFVVTAFVLGYGIFEAKSSADRAPTGGGGVVTITPAAAGTTGVVEAHAEDGSAVPDTAAGEAPGAEPDAGHSTDTDEERTSER